MEEEVGVNSISGNGVGNVVGVGEAGSPSPVVPDGTDGTSSVGFPNLDVDCSADSVENVDADLLGITVNSIDEAFKLYNDYAFRLGFSVRKGKQRYRSDGKTISMKKFFCAKAGVKSDKSKEGRRYSKLDVRTGCEASVQFHIDSNGVWTVTKHVKEHNHVLCSINKIHLLRSHREVSKNYLTYLENLRKSDIRIADGVRFPKNQSGGSPFLGFTTQDACNHMGLENLNKLDGSDSNLFVEIFRKRQTEEKDFFFDFEVDDDSRLCSFFWRDSRMKEDFEVFGDLLVHDTTHRTNIYNMICAPFVGMNHHCNKVMFGCGFLLNERVESFVWLFRSFFRSMGGKHPQTIMTNQCASMDTAIAQVFPQSRHRLCIWHIGENSKKHIKSLRSKQGFMDLFNYVLKCTETMAEFDIYWKRLLTDFECSDNSWLQRLHKCREKWSPPSSKDFFSGGVLSSQVSESTSHSISRRLTKTDGLCDLYNSFLDVVTEWRRRENGDMHCLQGKPDVFLRDVKLLSHAREVFTIEVYLLFEEQFKKGTACHQICFSSVNNLMKFHVWRPEVDVIKHEVNFDLKNLDVNCTCKLFLEMGILCCHCIRIMHINCVEVIPDKYILRRWMKELIGLKNVDPSIWAKSMNDSVVASSIWRLQMSSKFNQLVSCSEDNKLFRQVCEEAYDSARNRIRKDTGSVFIDDSDEVPRN